MQKYVVFLSDFLWIFRQWNFFCHGNFLTLSMSELFLRGMGKRRHDLLLGFLFSRNKWKESEQTHLNFNTLSDLSHDRTVSFMGRGRNGDKSALKLPQSFGLCPLVLHIWNVASKISPHFRCCKCTEPHRAGNPTEEQPKSDCDAVILLRWFCVFNKLGLSQKRFTIEKSQVHPWVPHCWNLRWWMLPGLWGLVCDGDTGL